jgi:hypothetical protein
MNLNEELGFNNIYKVVCRGADGEVKWIEEQPNLVTTEGKNHLLDTVFHGGTAVTTWYIGLKAAGTALVADTLAAHSSWAEVSTYSGTRKAWTEGAASSGSTTNASSVDFAISGTATAAGAFLASATSGTTGTLLGVADFSTSRSIVSGDTLQVTLTVTVS